MDSEGSNMKYVLTIILATIVVGCATATKINAIQLGMTKSEVITVMGEPVSSSAQGGAEYLNYALSENSDDAFYGITDPYYVRLINGRVESYGRTGDFDSTNPTTVRIETDENINVDEGSDLYTELRKLKELYDDGIISAEEYESLKQKAIREY